MKKMITVHCNRPIRAKGGVCGPILTPYKEDISIIFSMLSQNIKIKEILKDGTQVELNFSNFNTDNEKKESNIEKNEKTNTNNEYDNKQSYQQKQNFNKKNKHNHNKNNQYTQKENVIDDEPKKDNIESEKFVDTDIDDTIKVDEIEEI